MARLLVVDDEEIVRCYLQELLCDEGHTVDVAGSASAALAELGPQHDIVILDLKLPDQSGVQFLRLARERFPSLRFMVVTAYGSLESAIELLSAGATDYILKPLDDSREFLRRVARVVDELREPASVSELRTDDLPDTLQGAIDELRRRVGVGG